VEEVGASERWGREQKAEGERGENLSPPDRPAPHGAKRRNSVKRMAGRCFHRKFPR